MRRLSLPKNEPYRMGRVWGAVRQRCLIWNFCPTVRPMSLSWESSVSCFKSIVRPIAPWGPSPSRPSLPYITFSEALRLHSERFCLEKAPRDTVSPYLSSRSSALKPSCPRPFSVLSEWSGPLSHACLCLAVWGLALRNPLLPWAH